MRLRPAINEFFPVSKLDQHAVTLFRIEQHIEVAGIEVVGIEAVGIDVAAINVPGIEVVGIYIEVYNSSQLPAVGCRQARSSEAQNKLSYLKIRLSCQIFTVLESGVAIVD